MDARQEQHARCDQRCPCRLKGTQINIAKQDDRQIEVLRVTRQTAVKARRAALQQLRNTIIVLDEVREQTRNLTRMQLIRTRAAWRHDTEAAADPVVGEIAPTKP